MLFSSYIIGCRGKVKLDRSVPDNRGGVNATFSPTFIANVDSDDRAISTSPSIATGIAAAAYAARRRRTGY